MKITIKQGDIIAPVTVKMLDENGQLQEAKGKLHWKRLSQREVGELIASEHAAAVNALRANARSGQRMALSPS